MNLNKRFIICSILIILFATLLAIIISNTLLYDYKTKIDNNMNEYYETNNDTNIDNINKVLKRFQNNTSKLNSIKELINANIDNWITNKYNISYENKEQLDNNTKDIKNKINIFISKIERVSLEESNYIEKIDNLNTSKNNYLIAIDYYNNNDYNKAYEYLNLVSKDDIYYEDASSKIDTSIEGYLNTLTIEVNNLLSNIDESSYQDKIINYERIIEYLINEAKNTNISLTNSKTYNELLTTYENNLNNTYETYVKDLSTNNKYEEAITILNNAIKYFTDLNVNVKNLTELKSSYETMLPVSLTSLDIAKEEGTWFKEELAATDISKTTYKTAITYKRGSQANYKTNSLTYNLNKEYKKFTGTIANVYGIDDSNKDKTIIKIYGDDKLLFTSNKFSPTSKSQNFDIDVTNITNLKIIATITYNKKDTYDELYDNIVIGNPTISKY